MSSTHFYENFTPLWNLNNLIFFLVACICWCTWGAIWPCSCSINCSTYSALRWLHHIHCGLLLSKALVRKIRDISGNCFCVQVKKKRTTCTMLIHKFTKLSKWNYLTQVLWLPKMTHTDFLKKSCYLEVNFFF